MKMPHPATSVPISSPTQLHLSQMLTTTKHTWPSLTTRPPYMVHKQLPHGLTPILPRWKSTEHS
jgi:hypothetical protein